MDVSVLVVDDDAQFRGLAARMLTAQHLAVVGQAGTVAEATELAAALRPDAVLVDIGLPDGDGLTLTRWLVALPWRPRVVLTSSDRDATTPDGALDAGAIAFVAKDELPDSSIAKLFSDWRESESG